MERAVWEMPAAKGLSKESELLDGKSRAAAVAMVLMGLALQQC
jgi:hypothetical protein